MAEARWAGAASLAHRVCCRPEGAGALRELLLLALPQSDVVQGALLPVPSERSAHAVLGRRDLSCLSAALRASRVFCSAVV